MKNPLSQIHDTSIILLHRLTNLAVKQKLKPKSKIEMLDLSPYYNPKAHMVYVDILEDILTRKPKAKNIALSGDYGVGKSSILKEVKRHHKNQTISISFATLNIQEKTLNAENTSTTTNIIQKEIIKQILYSKHPVKMPESQYRRIAKINKPRTLFDAICCSILLTFILFIVGWTPKIKMLIPNIPYINNNIYATLIICFLFFIPFTLWVLCKIYSHFNIEQLSVDKAGFTLSANTDTFFDEYLDEIIYFFEVANKCDIVIFEDIDRFDNYKIFETLRSLNTILNAAEQLNRRNIRFIYAAKDSIFEPVDIQGQDYAQSELARTNRTKFFDIIIPVVPFITHTNARNLLYDAMDSNEHKVSTELIDLVARHIPDMRLIKNIKNEFNVFKSQVLDISKLDLNLDELFAIVVYKNIHLKDFELIRLGESDLDKLYKAYREIINSSTIELNDKISHCENELHEIITVKNIGNMLGTKFIDFITTMITLEKGNTPTYQYQGDAINNDTILTDKFWNKLAEDKGYIRVNYISQYGGRSSFDVAYENMIKIVDDPLNSEKWKRDEQQRINNLIDNTKKNIEFLKNADMRQLFERSEFKINNKAFDDILNEDLKSELSKELVRDGYINRNFTLYTSVFNGKLVSSNAMNFIIKNIDSDVVDSMFELTPDDVKSLIHERPNFINQKASYNVSIIDYLLENNDTNLDKVIDQLMQNGVKEKEFINIYFNSSKNKKKFIAVLAEQWEAVFACLVSAETILSDKDRVEMINIALQNMKSTISYDTDPTLKDFIEKHYRELEILQSAEITNDQATKISELFNHAMIEFDDITSITQSVRNEIVNINAYKINRINILLALNNSEFNLSLDQIRSASNIIYHHILDDIPSYLKILGSKELTIVTKDYLDKIIIDVLSASSSSLDAIVRRSDPSCIVDVLSNIPSNAWPILAKYKRFTMTLENIRLYIDKIGFDEALASMLAETGTIYSVDNIEEADKISIAKKILSASEYIASPELRTNIVASLKLNGFLADDSIPDADGKLIGWLINKKIVADNAETFMHIKTSDIDGLLFAISKSTNFKDFMSITEITAQNVNKVLYSSIVPKTVKDAIIKNFAYYTNGATRDVLESSAQYIADNTDVPLTLASVAHLATENVNHQLVIRLLSPHLADITLADITPILISLGDSYADLTKYSHKCPKFIKNEANLNLLNSMKRLGTVSTVSSYNLRLQAFMKHHA